jgi:hypothetical protein
LERDCTRHGDENGANTFTFGESIALRPAEPNTPFGAIGYAFEDGRTGFLFEKERIAPAVLRVRERLDRDPEGLRRRAAKVFARNDGAIDMDACASGLVEAIDAERWARPQS